MIFLGKSRRFSIDMAMDDDMDRVVTDVVTLMGMQRWPFLVAA